MLLYQQPDLLTAASQRISILFLFYEMYKTEPAESNPYATFFVQLLVSLVVQWRDFILTSHLKYRLTDKVYNNYVAQ